MVRKNKIIIVIICALFNLSLYSQTSTNEKPISFNYNENMFRTNTAKLRTMTSINLEELRIEDNYYKNILYFCNAITNDFNNNHKDK